MASPDSPAPVQVQVQVQKARRPTLQDVAAAASVSPMTASRVLTDPDRVRPGTRQRVLDAMEATGYVPNLVAGGLRTARSNLVVALLPTTTGSIFGPMIKSVTEALDRHGYQVLLGESGYATSREDNLVRAVLGHRPDGLLVVGSDHAESSAAMLRRAGVPIVEAWDWTPDPIDMVVGVDHHAIGEAVCAWLVARGHRRLACLTGEDIRGRRRVEGFLQEAARRRLPPPQVLTTSSPTTFVQGRVAMRDLLAQSTVPEAVFCSSDALAHGCLVQADSQGVDVPGRVAVVGLGDLDFAAHTTPSLTTVRIDGALIGHRAASMLEKRLRGEAVRKRAVDVGFELVERGSA